MQIPMPSLTMQMPTPSLFFPRPSHLITLTTLLLHQRLILLVSLATLSVILDLTILTLYLLFTEFNQKVNDLVLDESEIEIWSWLLLFYYI